MSYSSSVNMCLLTTMLFTSAYKVYSCMCLFVYIVCLILSGTHPLPFFPLHYLLFSEEKLGKHFRIKKHMWADVYISL